MKSMTDSQLTSPFRRRILHCYRLVPCYCRDDHWLVSKPELQDDTSRPIGALVSTHRYFGGETRLGGRRLVSSVPAFCHSLHPWDSPLACLKSTHDACCFLRSLGRHCVRYRQDK